MLQNFFKCRFIFVFSLLLLAGIDVSAQVQKISGIVKDKRTKEPIFSATIVEKGTTSGSNSDINGRFTLMVDLSSPKIISISYLGYIAAEIQVSKSKTEIEVFIEEDIKTTQAALVQASRISDKQKEAPLTVESMDMISIKQTSASNFYEGLGQLKGVDLTSASIGFKVINTRGFNSTSPVRSLQLIDGVDNQAPGLNFSLGNFLGSSELDVQKVDLIVGASSAFYGPNAFNGVINMQTRNPFNSAGLSVMTKAGERGLFESAIRYAEVFKNKDSVDVFAFKINMYYMRAYDWEATNLDATPQSTVGISNPGRYDAVNRYGDENFDPRGNNATSNPGKRFFPGLKVWHRPGYEEKDIVDYNTENIKLGTALHYKVNPAKNTELIYAFNFGNGTTVYQGDNRYSLKDILFFQNRLELRNDNFFIRAYATHEDAGKSYDAVFTSLLLQESHKPTFIWSADYQNYWGRYIRPKVEALPGYPPAPVFPQPFDFAAADSVMLVYNDSIVKWHSEALYYANLATSPTSTSPTGIIYEDNVNRYEPGTARFDSAFNSIISKTSFTEGGSRFFDKSALYHIQAERKFKIDRTDWVLGGNYRLYTPNSQGSIFSDTAGKKITNYEYGLYTGLERKYLEDKLKINLTARIDKNQNFNYVVSPAASAVYNADANNILRFSFSSAIRNPTLADQYLFLNVGRAILIGNTGGFDSLLTVPSLYAFFNSQNKDTLEYFDIDPVRPERVRSFEFGYRTTLFEKVFIDASYYFSYYNDFIGYKLGVKAYIDTVNNTLDPTKPGPQAYRVSANSNDMVTTQGFSVGLTYFFKNFFTLSGNYSWNVLDLRGSEDPIIPAFNTPEHKFNIGIAGRDIDRYFGSVYVKNWSFSMNYKWVQGFEYEGSPQFTGYVPTYDMLDIQVSKHIPKVHTTIKVGASNVLNKKSLQVYGGPYVGRLAYVSLLFDVKRINN